MRLSRLLMLLSLCITAPAAARNMDGMLVAETARAPAGAEVALALVLTPHRGWHGYWANPGEAGFPPTFTWTLPKAAIATPPDYPVPQTLIVAGLANYVFEGQHALLFRLKLPKTLAPGTAVPLALDAKYLVCTEEVCVPEHQTFTRTLFIGDATARDARFDAWRAKLPAPLAAEAHFQMQGPLLRFAIPYPANAAINDPRIYPLSLKSIIDSAPQSFARVGDNLVGSVSAAPNFNAASIGGVLAIGNGRGLSFTAVPGPVPAVPKDKPAGDARTIIVAILGAVLGGLILNVMPCVFPILSLKALSLAHAGGDERTARREALAYAAGAIVVLTALGALVLALKVGWAFQLQDPRVVLILFALMVALTLNLLGVFELPTIGGGAQRQRRVHHRRARRFRGDAVHRPVHGCSARRGLGPAACRSAWRVRRTRSRPRAAIPRHRLRPRPPPQAAQAWAVDGHAAPPARGADGGDSFVAGLGALASIRIVGRSHRTGRRGDCRPRADHGRS